MIYLSLLTVLYVTMGRNGNDERSKYGKEKEKEKKNRLVYYFDPVICSGGTVCHAGMFFYNRLL